MKFTCNECSLACTCDVQGFVPVHCLLTNVTPNWESNEVPKLTREVFMRDDCPSWANYACVNKYGKLCFTETEPHIINSMYRSCEGKFVCVEKILYTTANWKTNILKRYRLPEWCTQDEYLYDCKLNVYARITDITGLDETVSVLYVGNKDTTDLSEQYVNDNCIEACVAEYDDKDMEDLVGQIIVDKFRDTSLVLEYNSKGMVCIKDKEICPFTLMNEYHKKDGTPCCVFQRKEDDGEWYKGVR